MNKLSKDKRDKLILICLGVVGVISVLYFLVMSDMKDEIALLNSKIVTTDDKKVKSERVLKMQSNFEQNLEQLRKTLVARQAQMPSPGEDHVWFLRIMEERRTHYNLDLAEIRNPEPWEPGVLPNFPFRGVSFNVTMIGGYTDFGRFLADFENAFPYMRVQLMSVAPDTQITVPGTAPTPTDEGKLRFNFRVISLIKTQT